MDRTGDAQQEAQSERAGETAARDVPVVGHPVTGPGGPQAPPAEPTAAVQPGRPPAGPAGRVLPLGFRRPPAESAGRLLPESIARPPVLPADDDAPTIEMDALPVEHAPEAVPEPAAELEPEAEPEPEAEREPEGPAAEHEPAAEQEPEAEPEPEAEQEPDAEHEPEMSEPRPSLSPGPHPRSRRTQLRPIRVVGLVGAILILMAAGGVTLALARPQASGRPVGHVVLATGSAQMAARWISQQVSPSTIVACDPAMCSALEAAGVPGANLLVLRTAAASPLDSQLVVATPTLRRQFGSRLDSVYAPIVIAVFGSGSGRVDVQVTAPDGAAAYQAALRKDVASRQVAGAELVANKHISVTPQAVTQLKAGEVDARLLILLPALAAMHPIQILAFGDPGPGAAPGVPLCSADLSGSGRAAGMTDASYLSWLTSFVRAQLPPFAGHVITVRQAGQLVVRVEFSRPSPLGLLGRG